MIVLILILLIFFIYENKGDYKQWVDSCVSRMSSCLYTYTAYDSQGNPYIKNTAKGCVDDLKRCVSNCEENKKNFKVVLKPL